jgi:hypothetical protein
VKVPAAPKPKLDEVLGDGANINGQGHYKASIATKEIGFFLRHPKIALKVGKYERYGLNLSTTAANFMLNSALKINIDGATDAEENKGSEWNAIRHTIWMAILTKEFGTSMAKQIANAHEANPLADLTKRNFNKMSEADETVDLLNNVIGRSIGSSNINASNKDLALKSLDEFQKHGLWTVEKKPNGTFSIKKTKITASQYKTAYNKMSACNEYGYNPNGEDWKKIQAKK